MFFKVVLSIVSGDTSTSNRLPEMVTAVRHAPLTAILSPIFVPFKGKSAVIASRLPSPDGRMPEIMPNPSALSDTEGEWFEIYNNSDRVINLQNLILGRNDVNRHTITDSIDLSPGSYMVFERTELATDASGYTYGSGILLSNTGAVLSIFNEGTETEPGALIFSVDYGGTDFPNVSGASISLSPERINAADAVMGTSWCSSISVYSTGDLGTPGAVNDSCQ